MFAYIGMFLLCFLFSFFSLRKLFFKFGFSRKFMDRKKFIGTPPVRRVIKLRSFRGMRVGLMVLMSKTKAKMYSEFHQWVRFSRSPRPRHKIRFRIRQAWRRYKYKAVGFPPHRIYLRMLRKRKKK